MPGLVAFGRRWSIGSDDLFLPSISLFIFHLIWISVTISAIIVDFEELNNWRKNGCTAQVLEIMCCILVLLLFGSIVEFSLTLISLRGSILNDTPRCGVPYLMYIRMFSLILELIWSVFAIVWNQKFYFTCNLVFTKQVMIGLIVWTWFVLLSIIVTAWCVYDVAGRSWVKMKRYQANVKEMEHRHPSFKRSGSTQRNWRQRKVMRKYESSWNNRCRLLFCCIHNSDSSRDSFGDLAKLLSEFFRDLDVVPSDIIVGLLLLRKLQRLEQCSIINEKRNNTYEFLSGIAITPNTKFVAMNDAHDLEAYHNVVHYMRYASAAYGWLWYVIPNGFHGLVNLCSNVRCCFHRYLCNSLGNELSDVVVEDNCCFCNVAVIPTMFDSTSFDIVYATYHVDVGETPFFVVVDYDKKAIVVSIRGTLSLKDLMTDFNAEAEPLPMDPVREDWLGHKGMVQVAGYLKSKLLEENILDRAFEMCQSRSNGEEFNLVLVGHSLGGGAAAILAILLRDQFPNLVCYAYSPPGGLLSMPAVEYTKEFVTSVIVGKDLVPRIGLSQMEALRADLINAIKKSHTPKWQTIMSRVKGCKCISRSEFSTTDLSGSPTRAANNDNSSASQRSFQDADLLSPNDSMVSMTMHQPLYPPGRIMHVVRHHPKKDEIKYESIWRRIAGKGEPVFQAIWTENTDYDQVLISPGMIQDHMPDTVLKALSRVTTSMGPAKPQRTLTSNASPMNLIAEGPGGVEGAIESSSKLHSETSFASEVSAPCVNGWAENKIHIHHHHQPSTLPQINDIIAPDIDNEECQDMVSLAGSHSTETLFSLKISWDYFKELGKHPSLKLMKRHSHTRNSSSGSSNCSELGTTMKELFGPIKLYECTVPLASSETLSEISSMSSRASFNIMKDRSPLTKLKLAKNLSLRVHDNGNGDATYEIVNNMSGKSHQRSFSCVYPEGKKSNLLNPYGTLNGGSKNGSNNIQQSPNPEDDVTTPIVVHGENGNANHFLDDVEMMRNNEYTENQEENQNDDGDYVHGEDDEEFGFGDHQSEELNGQAILDSLDLDADFPPPPPQEDDDEPEEEDAEDGDGDQEEEDEGYDRGGINIAQKAERKSDSVKEEGAPCVDQKEYSPVYPVFSILQEYGAPSHADPHYAYSSGQTPPLESENGNHNNHNDEDDDDDEII